MEIIQMDSLKVKLSSIIGIGVLATSPVIGVEDQTYASLIESNCLLNSTVANEFIFNDYSDRLYNSHFYFKHDIIKLGTDPDIDEYYEPGVTKIPVAKRVLFQFKKPVKLIFS